MKRRITISKNRNRRIYNGRAKLNKEEFEMMQYGMKHEECSQSKFIRFLIQQYYDDLTRSLD